MKNLGQVGYEAYGEAAGWKTYDGKAMPPWDDARPGMEETRRRWDVAAQAIARTVSP